MTIKIHDLRQVSPDLAEAWLLQIADNLRPTDLDEVSAMSDLQPRDVILQSFHLSSHCYLVKDRTGQPIAVFGAAPFPLPGVGVVWMLGTPSVDREAIAIARSSRPSFDLLNEAYPLALWNYIDDRNKVSTRWLRWGGFKVVGKTTMGPDNLPFHLFARSLNDV